MVRCTGEGENKEKEERIGGTTILREGGFTHRERDILVEESLFEEPFTQKKNNNATLKKGSERGGKRGAKKKEKGQWGGGGGGFCCTYVG